MPPFVSLLAGLESCCPVPSGGRRPGDNPFRRKHGDGERWNDAAMQDGRLLNSRGLGELCNVFMSYAPAKLMAGRRTK